MKCITLVGQKGGCGKTTLATNLASEWKNRGLKVLLVDTDEQRSSERWASLNPDKTPATICMGSNLQTQLPQVSASYDIVVIDTPARFSVVMGQALMRAHMAIMPVIPSDLDYLSLQETLGAVLKAQSINVGLIARVALNGLNPRSCIGREASANVDMLIEQAIQHSGGGDVSVLNTRIGQREDFRKAVSAGLGVTTYEPSSLASLTIRNLCDELEEILHVHHA